MTEMRGKSGQIGMPDRAPLEAIGRKTSGRTSRIWTAIGLLTLLLAGAWYWLGHREARSAVHYLTDPASVADLTVTVTATGTIEPVNTVDVSSELSGTIRAVHADFNDSVRRGDALAELDTDKLEASVQQARAAVTARKAGLAEAQATLDEMSDAYERATNLYGRGVQTLETMLAAKASFGRAEAGLKTAQANLEVAEADLRLAEISLRRACICSPIAGIVLSRAVEVGQIVASSLQTPTLFTLAEDLKRMNLKVDIDEADIGHVAVGNPARFTVEAFQDRSFEAEIVQVRFAPETIDGVVTYKAILEVDNGDLLLRPGMTATAEIVVAEFDGVLTVSNAALRFSPPVAAQDSRPGAGGLLGMVMPRPPVAGSASGAGAVDAAGMRSLWVLRDGEPREVRVRTGPTDGKRTQILEGELREGEPVVTDMSASG